MKKKQIYPYILAAATIASMSQGCKVVKPYSPPKMDSTIVNKLYRDSSVTDTSTMAKIAWNDFFTDTHLQALIAEGLANNLNLKTYVEKVNEAAATFKESKMAFLPTLTAGPQVTSSKSSKAALNFPSGININLKTVTYQLALSSTWEVDIWGKLKSSKKAALANLLASDAAQRAIQTQIVANIATYYYDLLAYDQQLKITNESIERYKKDVESNKALMESGTVNGASIVQSEANLHSAEVTLPTIKQNIRETENAICLLLGKEPGPIERGTLEEQIPYQNIQTGLPASLLRYRPDVQQAELSYRYYFENTNYAKASMYPSLAITAASGGLSTLKLKNFFKESGFYSLTGSLLAPILYKGTYKAQYKTAIAQQNEALYAFQTSMLTAGQEVSNALYSYKTALDLQTARKAQISSLEKSVDFTRDLMEYTQTYNFTDVLTSEQTLLAAQLSGVSDKLQEFTALVTLYQALGGGWK
ncbi:efflux transporter outer membrane subunit [Rhizosphaericola mali]|uniref:Efflux transporter outer membrane subunit n=1 Tax=Rhizosphaericola mali TaxID=2545455 RepID=A0A5P2G472_9BACT|nr:efflux transporter outer membrane subunit [Rhizosphaericola mali]QES88949.1 efflux transporter outer membrane subunit [Rhizosphaericola mali]